MTNLFRKRRDVAKPYAIYIDDYGFEYRVLKTYKLRKNENLYSTWLTAVKSPATFDRFEYGDSYKAAVQDHTRLVYAEPEWSEEYARNPDEQAKAMAVYLIGNIRKNEKLDHDFIDKAKL